VAVTVIEVGLRTALRRRVAVFNAEGTGAALATVLTWLR
jgi:hypothetical protein